MSTAKATVLWPNFEKRGGIVVAVVQNAMTGEVLMVAYTDEDNFRRTLETGNAWFFSTSRKASWMKGESSGNTQRVVEVLVDCDGDAVLYRVVPEGAGLACHTDARSCFYRSVVGARQLMLAPKAGKHDELSAREVLVTQPLTQEVIVHTAWSLDSWEARICERATADPTKSYTRKLLDKGAHECAKKIGEEAVELAIASVSEDDQRVISEAADVMYHLLVLLISRNLDFAAIGAELQRREATSGLEEKAARAKP